MDFSSYQPRSRSRSRTRTKGTNSRSTSSTRRPLLPNKKSNSSTSLNKLSLIPSSTTTPVEFDKPVPSIQAVLDNSLPLDFFKLDLIGLIKALKIHKWHKRQLTIANMLVSRISGALTNSIYKLEYIDEQQNLRLPALLLRVYGKNVDSIIDRELELAILIKLSAKRIGPRLLGIFINGRFEQFLEGFITLNKDQIRKPVISQILGRRMKDLHYKIDLDLKDFESTLPMSWKLIYKWLNLFETEYLQNYNDNKFDFKDFFLVDFARFKELIETYKNFLFSKYSKNSFHQNYKFCHNDTQYGNLLLHENFRIDATTEEEKETQNDSHLVVIDFEYSGANFPAFDFANHFCEWMSDYNHPDSSYYIFHDNFPTEKEQLNMIQAYVEFEVQHPTTKLEDEKENPKDIVKYETEKLYNECVYWRPSVSIYWFLWGLIQNGQYKPPPSLAPQNLVVTADDIGVDSTYTISHQLESTTLEGEVVEEAITSTDDDFNYMKYSQQKVCLVIGDLIGLGLLKKEEIDEKHWHLIKNLDTSLFDL